jgi:hypothetical protein
MKLIFIILTLSVISYTHAQQQKKMYQVDKTSGKCSTPITTIAECQAAAVAMGLTDTVVNSANEYWYSNFPRGCWRWPSGTLSFGTHSTGSNCNSQYKCLCSITCPRDTYQDEDGQTTCKNCPTGSFQPQSGQSRCILPACSYADGLIGCSDAELVNVKQFYNVRKQC